MTHVQDGMSLLSVPVNNGKKEALGAFLEAMASESYKNVSPVYFNTAMKVKYARDEVSAKMLDIIREGIDLNFEKIYNNSIGGAWNLMRQLMMTKSSNFASWYEKNEGKITAAIDKLVEQMQKS